MEDPAKTLGLAEFADDYRPAPPSRRSQPWSLSAITLMTVLGALAVGFLISSGITAGRSAAVAQDVRKEQLIALIEERQARVDAMTEQLESLRGQVTELEDEATSPGLRRMIEQLEQAAGLTPLRGPGLVVSLEDASGPCPSGRQEDCQIQDTDLQLAANALFDAGAEAVAINGERMIATTAIRSAGGAILVNYRVLSPPYELAAIGDPETLESRFTSSEFAIDLRIWQDTYGLGFAAEVDEELTLPAYAGSIGVGHAAPAGEEGSR